MAIWQGEVTLKRREALSAGYFKLSFDAPEIAVGVEPGLFVTVLVPAPELCLRRPLSVHRVEGREITLLVGIQGRGTAWLGGVEPGATLDVMGPLGGRGLTISPGARRIALVGGGVGIPPLHLLVQRNSGRGIEWVTFLGARNSSRLLCVEEFEALGATVRLSTDDGSVGFAGTAVEALASYLEGGTVDQVLTCGPTPMMRGVAELALARGIPCQVCLEARMACAVGACLSCVVETKTAGWRRYQRVCTEGPVFEAGELVWETLSPLCAL